MFLVFIPSLATFPLEVARKRAHLVVAHQRALARTAFRHNRRTREIGNGRQGHHAKARGGAHARSTARKVGATSIAANEQGGCFGASAERKRAKLAAKRAGERLRSRRERWRQRRSLLSQFGILCCGQCEVALCRHGQGCLSAFTGRGTGWPTTSPGSGQRRASAFGGPALAVGQPFAAVPQS